MKLCLSPLSLTVSQMVAITLVPNQDGKKQTESYIVMP